MQRPPPVLRMDDELSKALKVVEEAFEKAWPRLRQDFEPWQQDAAQEAFLHGYTAGLKAGLDVVGRYVARVNRLAEKWKKEDNQPN